MKINLHNKISQAVSSIIECHGHIRSLHRSDELINFLMLCQDVAISVGQTLEEQSTNTEVNKNIVSLLEVYCENIYQLSCVENMRSDGFLQLLDVCDKHISIIQSKIATDIPKEKMVVAFLPYMASMWDCLDSICREAMLDDDWDVHVLPVPYYSISKKGQVTADNFEYEQFPQDLPLVDYKKCPLEKLSPDVIFYHNPYDDRNSVTQVHSEFFSRNLQKITPYLVYVPYFFSIGRTFAHMPDMPGVQNAWRVVIPDSIKGQYLAKYPSEKVVALGSPKLDALFNYSLKDVPRDWQAKMDGRKVFFFNTHLTSAMVTPDKFLGMLDYIMDIMCSDKDIAVLWRPHPLMQDTFKSFDTDPHILNEYKKKVEIFRAMDNGIYDDTPDLHRSLALSDAYIGTIRSSVYRLYTQLSKPSYVIPDIFERDWWETTSFYSGTGGLEADGYIWIFDINCNGLFKMDIESEKMYYVATMDKYPFDNRRLYTVADRCKNLLVLLPFKKNHIALFDFNVNETKYIQLEDEDFTEDRFLSCHVSDDTITVVNYNSTKYYYSISTHDFTCKKEYIDENGRFLGVTNGHIFTYDDNIHELTSIKLEDRSKISYPMPHGFLFDELPPFIQLENDSLIVVNRGEGTLYYWKNALSPTPGKRWVLHPECQKDADTRIRMCHLSNGNLLFSSSNSNAIYCCNIIGESKRTVLSATNYIGAVHSLSAVGYSNNIYITSCSFSTPYILKIDDKLTNATAIPHKINGVDELQDSLCTILKKNVNSHCISQPIDFIRWMEIVKKQNVKPKTTITKKSTIGAVIWQHISVF